MTIDRYLTLTVADCKRLGFLRPNAICSGSIQWTRGGAVVASVGFGTLTTGVPVARFAYDYNGETRTYDVALRWKRSNLNPDSKSGYYYFVFPEDTDEEGNATDKVILVNRAKICDFDFWKED